MKKKVQAVQPKIDMQKEYLWWGIGLIIAGIIPFIFPEVLDLYVGVIALILGIITLVFRQRWNLAVIGAFILLVGAFNIISTLIVQEQYAFLFLGMLQIFIGVGALNRYHQLGKIEILVRKKKGKIGNGFGIAGLVLGISSILTSIFIPLIAVITGILGIIFSIKQKNESPNGMATAGLVTSIIGLVIGVINWVVGAILLAGL